MTTGLTSHLGTVVRSTSPLLVPPMSNVWNRVQDVPGLRTESGAADCSNLRRARESDICPARIRVRRRPAPCASLRRTKVKGAGRLAETRSVGCHKRIRLADSLRCRTRCHRTLSQIRKDRSWRLTQAATRGDETSFRIGPSGPGSCAKIGGRGHRHEHHKTRGNAPQSRQRTIDQCMACASVDGPPRSR